MRNPSDAVQHVAIVLDDRRLWQPLAVLVVFIVPTMLLTRLVEMSPWLVVGLFVPAFATAFRLRGLFPSGIGRKPTPRIGLSGDAGDGESVSEIWLRRELPGLERLLTLAPWSPSLIAGAVLWSMPMAFSGRHEAITWALAPYDGPTYQVSVVRDEVEGNRCRARGVAILLENELATFPGLVFRHRKDLVSTSDLVLDVRCDGQVPSVEIRYPTSDGSNHQDVSSVRSLGDDLRRIAATGASGLGLQPYTQRNIGPLVGEALLDVTDAIGLGTEDPFPAGAHGGLVNSLGIRQGLELYDKDGPLPGPGTMANLARVRSAMDELSQTEASQYSRIAQTAFLTWSGTHPYEGVEIGGRAVVSSPSHAGAWLAFGEAQMAANQWAAGRASLTRAMALAPDLPGPRLALARYYRLQRQHSQALDLLKPLVQTERPYPEAVIETGWNFLGRGDLAGAVIHTEAAIAAVDTPRSWTRAHYLAARLAYYRRDWARNRRELHALQARSRSLAEKWEYSLQLVLALWAQDRRQAMVQAAQELAEEIADNSEPPTQSLPWIRQEAILGVALAIAGNSEAGLRHSEAALERLPLMEHGLLGPQQHFDNALVHLALGRQLESIDRFGYTTAVPSEVTPRLLGIDPLLAVLQAFPTFRESARFAPSDPP